jgi:putative hydrolase of the HAD superfamily
MTRLALFDLDNTLVDRARAFEGWMDLFIAEQSLPAEARSIIHRFDGDGFLPREQFFENLREEFSLETPIKTLLDRYYVDYISRFVVESATVDALRSLRADGWKLAVVTNGPPSQMRKLEVANLVHEFDAVCVSDIVGSHKPDARIFEEAARRCGLPLDGWMVGDSPSADIVGGQRAQLRTIWMSRGRTWDEAEPAPDAIVTSIPEAVNIIASS